MHDAAAGGAGASSSPAAAAAVWQVRQLTPARTWLGRLAGDARQASAEEIRPGEDARAFYHLSTPKKLVVMLGGPVMNLFIALFLMAVVLVGIGLPTVTTNLAGVSTCVIPADADPDRECTSTDQAAPSAAAGIEPGDQVVSYDGTEITSWEGTSMVTVVPVPT